MVKRWSGRLVLLVGNEYGRLLDARTAVEAFGASVAATLPFGTDRSAFAAFPEAALVMVEIDQDRGSVQDDLLDWIDARGRAGHPAIVSFARDCLDAVAARITAPTVLMLCDAAVADRVAALVLARRPEQSGFVAEAESVDETLRLRRLADDLSRIAHVLSDIGEGRRRAVLPLAGQAGGDAPASSDIHRIIRQRRLRDRYFGQDLFADPAWDILLDLTASRLQGVRVSVSSVCIAAAVPATTGLRWIRMMTEMGLLVRISDERDGRRVYVDLAEGSFSAMMRLLAEMRQA